MRSTRYLPFVFSFTYQGLCPIQNHTLPPDAAPAARRAIISAEVLKNAENVTLLGPHLDSINNTAGGTWAIDPATFNLMDFANLYEVLTRVAAAGPDLKASFLEGAKGKIDLGTAAQINNVAGGAFDFTGGNGKKGKRL